MLIDDLQSGTWVVAFTERVISICSVVLIAAYEEYHLWYVPPDIIAFERGFGMAMEVVLRSRRNVLEMLELLQVVESTRFVVLLTYGGAVSRGLATIRRSDGFGLLLCLQRPVGPL